MSSVGTVFKSTTGSCRHRAQKIGRGKWNTGSITGEKEQVNEQSECETKCADAFVHRKGNRRGIYALVGSLRDWALVRPRRLRS